MDDEIKANIHAAHQMVLAGATGNAVLFLLEAVEGLVDRVDLLSSLLVASSPEAARLIRTAAGLGPEGEA
jgi:hypothetical protein